jgi:3-hydroxyacyl-CoA dehydrogenase/enoyl-CoA hydratase/3-hydroxybutyryl-CoA epimerase
VQAWEQQLLLKEFDMKNFEISTDNNVLIAYWNMPDRSMNVIDDTFMDDLEELIDIAVGAETVKGVLIASSKKDFSGGADLSMLENSKRQYEQSLIEHGQDVAMQDFFDHSSRLSRLYRKLETCGKPFACVINGVCLGGAFEFALACHYRVMTKDAKVGLPEVKVGLFPGAGGTQRVGRLMETDKALQFLLKGNNVDAEKAKQMNLVHYVSDDAVDVAKVWIESLGDPVAPWDKKDFKTHKVFSPKGMMTWPAANALYRKETFDNYPGARAILTAVYEGLQVNIDTGLRIESRLFANILRSKEAEAMIRTLFLSKNELDKGARRPKEFPPTNIKKVGVIGAGLMGAGIAYASALNGLYVVLLDATTEKVKAGKQSIDKLISKQVARGKTTEQAKNGILDRIMVTTDYAALQDVDLVIEAVFEDRAVKEEVLQKVQAAVGLDTIIASNTSTLPITSLAESVNDPGSFIGIHFFSPVDKMMLVEVIMGKATHSLALATALDYIRIIKKTPIVVNDSRGFYANRCVLSYVLEGHLMLSEGVPPAMIENAAKMAGMPMGPLALNDEVGLDLGWKILLATKNDLGSDAVNPVQENLLRYMVEENKRYGKKNNAGFYDYADGKKMLWSGLNNMYGILVPDLVDIEELKERFLFVQSLEAARTMEEGIVTDAREADVGSIFAFGFPPFTGGTISFIKQTGKDKFIQTCERLEKKFGPRFAVPKMIKDM